VLGKQFHPTKNGKRKAKDLVPTSKLPVWWKCPKGDDHEFLMRPSDRTVRGYGCPFCSRQKFSATFSLLAEFPQIARQWNKRKNGEKSPDNTSFGSKALAWWQCNEGPDHEWQQGVGHITRKGYKCPFCAGSRLSVTNNLEVLFPALANEWHKKKNVIRSKEVLPGSSYKPWWRCSACDHEWERECYL
jgi:hypothetical protein